MLERYSLFTTSVEPYTCGFTHHVAGGTGHTKLLTWGRHIFVLNLRIFSPNQFQIPFIFSKTQSLEYLFLKFNNLQLK